jgi:tetratricopeptide (TPR) repeat protein
MVGVRVDDPIIDELQQLVAGARLHLVRGKQALEAKRFTDAAEEFRKAIAAEPESVAAHVNLGAVLTQVGDLKGATAEFETALKIDPTNVNAHYNLAVLSANENKYEQAVDHLRAVSRVNPRDLNARYLLGQQLIKLDHADNALEEFSYIVREDPNNEQALIEQVKLLNRKRMYKEALDALEKAFARYPQKTQTAITLAYWLAASPKYELRDGAKALQLAQPVFEVTGSLQHGAVVGLALAELGRCAEAAALQRKLIAAAAREGNAELEAKLKADLRRYENGPSCRPGEER